MNAADRLEAKPLLHLSTAKMGSIIRGMSVKELRKRFDIVNDFSPMEEAIPYDPDMVTTLAALELELEAYKR